MAGIVFVSLFAGTLAVTWTIIGINAYRNRFSTIEDPTKLRGMEAREYYAWKSKKEYRAARRALRTR